MSTLRNTPPTHVHSLFVSNGDAYIAVPFGDQAFIWKNGECLYHLSEWSRISRLSVCVSGNEVFVAGIAKNSLDEWVTALWKNGEVLYLLNEGEDRVDEVSLCVAGGDVRAFGLVNEKELPSVAIMWENGKETRRYTMKEPEHAFASSVFAFDGDVYAAGFVYTWNDEPGREWTAVVWKNGEPLYRFTGEAGGAVVSSVFASGGDVYCVGFEPVRNQMVAMVWKNGDVLWRIGHETLASWAESVYVAGQDVYVAGCVGESLEDSVAMVWKNGQPLYSLSSGNSIVLLGEIAVSGDDVYVTAQELIDGCLDSVGRLWKNGASVDLLC